MFSALKEGAMPPFLLFLIGYGEEREGSGLAIDQSLGVDIEIGGVTAVVALYVNLAIGIGAGIGEPV